MSHSITSAQLVADVAGQPLVELTINTKNADGAAQLAAIGNGILKGYQQQFVENRGDLLGRLPPDEGPDLLKAADELFEAISLDALGNQVTLKISKPESWHQLPQLLQPLVATVRQQAQRAGLVNNAKYVALGLHNYAEVNRVFPASAAPANEGGPAVSWRVKLLPFFDENELHNEYRYDEPWDSEHNLTLVKKMPALYGSDPDGNTSVLGVVSPDSFFRTRTPLAYEDLSDGFSNTIMFVVAGKNRAVPWTKPVDLVPNPDDPLTPLGVFTEESFLAAFADGSVRALPKTISGNRFHAMTTVAGGERIDIGDLQP